MAHSNFQGALPPWLHGKALALQNQKNITVLPVVLSDPT